MRRERGKRAGKRDEVKKGAFSVGEGGIEGQKGMRWERGMRAWEDRGKGDGV